MWREGLGGKSGMQKRALAEKGEQMIKCTVINEFFFHTVIYQSVGHSAIYMTTGIFCDFEEYQA